MISGMVDVLFLCTGNICRSAYAERRAQQWFPGSVIASAGTHAMRGWGVDEHLAEVLIERGGSADGFSARQLTEPIARGSRLILCATREHRAFVLDAWPDLADRTFVMRAYARDLGTAPRAPLWSALSPADGRPALTRRDDIADPYRLGSPEAARTADEIDEVLRAVEQARG